MNDEIYMQCAAAVGGHGGLNRIVQRAAPIDGAA
jgi:hypothetical protein